MKLEPPSRDFSITRLAPDGIIERRINTDSLNDNGVYVEYEDDNMDLEYEGKTTEIDFRFEKNFFHITFMQILFFM